MVDSWGKLADGLEFGNVHMVGMYQECLDIEESIPVSMENYTQIDFQGKYCTIYYE